MTTPSTPESRNIVHFRPPFNAKTPLTPHTPSRMSGSGTQHSTPYTPLSSIYARSSSTAATTPASEKPPVSPIALRVARSTVADDIPDWRAAAIKHRSTRASQYSSPSTKNIVSSIREPSLLPSPAFTSNIRRSSGPVNPSIYPKPNGPLVIDALSPLSPVEQWRRSCHPSPDASLAKHAPSDLRQHHPMSLQSIYAPTYGLQTPPSAAVPRASVVPAGSFQNLASPFFEGTASSRRYLPQAPPAHEEPPSQPRAREPTPADPDARCIACGLLPSSPHSSRMVVLSPCTHLVCSSCLTSSLNIVGEKSFACMSCRRPVEDFKICPPTKRGGEQRAVPMVAQRPIDTRGEREQIAAPNFQELPLDASENCVLRLDNVPWDITPTAIQNWVNLPTLTVHVLLDRNDGRTLSHAYVEASAAVARTMLTTCRNKILGAGRRARAVTVTITTQEELMAALFPSWSGGFTGSQPAISKLSRVELDRAISHGLLTSIELDTLLHLIQNPKSHFLKVPTLPFYLLASILAKFPQVVVYTNALRDRLFDITQTAMHILTANWDKPDFNSTLFSKFAGAAVQCRAFTDDQLDQLLSFIDTNSSSAGDSESLPEPDQQQQQLGQRDDVVIVCSPVLESRTVYDALAAEYGLNPDVVKALSARLSGV